MENIASIHIFFGRLTSRVPDQPFHASYMPVDGRLVQSRVPYGRLFVKVSYSVDFQKPTNETVNIFIYTVGHNINKYKIRVQRTHVMSICYYNVLNK